MCRMVVEEIKKGNAQVIEDAKRLAYGIEDVVAMTPQHFCNKVFTTVYMGMKKQSSKETRNRAADLAKEIGSHHIDTNIDGQFNALCSAIEADLGYKPRFKTEGGQLSENLALQNFQSRSRMVYAYGLAQLILTSRGT